MSYRRQTTIGVATLCVSLFLPVACQADDSAAVGLRAKRLSAVNRFGYQLQKIKVAEAAESPADLLVLEPHGDDERLTPAEVARLRKKPDGRPRIVLAYLSIGEAEDYRPYWKKVWKREPPAWLGPENPDWKGNFEVHYWDDAWQSLILGQPDAQLDQIVADGYDGVYLDIVDGFEFWEERGVKDARTKMVAWIERIASYARTRRADFLVVAQNGEALVEEPGYLGLVDALGREDFYFNGDKRQKPKEVNYVENFVAQFKKAGKPVFLIDYPRKPENREEMYRRAIEAGYVPLVTVRQLNRLIVTPER